MRQGDLIDNDKGSLQMARVFLATSDAKEAPLTIVADGQGEAFRVVYMWREAHAPHTLPTDIWLIELGDDDLKHRPDLAKIADGESLGVAYWAGSQSGWLVVAPESKMLGEVAPPSPSLRCFGFLTMEEGGTYVVAETFDQATKLLHAYSHHINGWDPQFGAAVEISAWLLHGKTITLRDEMFAGKSGIAHRCEDGIWRVFPPSLVPRSQSGSTAY